MATKERKPPGTITECRSCRAKIVWVITKNGKKMPVDTPGRADGLFVMFKDPTSGEYIAHGYRDDEPSHQGRKRFTSHFATCPNAAQHRRGP